MYPVVSIPTVTGPRQGAVELFDGVARVGEFLLQDFARVGVQGGHLLLPTVQIATDEDHEGGLLSRGAVALGWPERNNPAELFS